MALSFGGASAPSKETIEYHNEDFAYIPRHRGAPAAAHKVAHYNNEQFIRAKNVKKEARKKVPKEDRLWIKWKGRNPYTHMVLDHPPTPADGKGWVQYLDFSLLEDDDCVFSERPMTSWTNPETGQSIENAMWEGSGDRAFTVEEIAAMPANLTALTIAQNNWGYWGTHAYREQVERIRKAMM